MEAEKYQITDKDGNEVLADVSGNEANPEIKQSGEVALPFFCISYMQKMGRCYDQCSACEFLDKNKNGNDC